jgi:hypothetical protein
MTIAAFTCAFCGEKVGRERALQLRVNRVEGGAPSKSQTIWSHRECLELAITPARIELAQVLRRNQPDRTPAHG